jgi:hypothetical protein
MSEAARGVTLTPAQLATARHQLGLAEDASELRVQAEIMLRTGLADELIAEAESVLASEWEYLEFAVAFGWRPE